MPKDPRKPKKTPHPNSLKALRENAKPFTKGDPRINRKGAPNTTSAMRTLIREIGAELVKLQDTTITGRKRTTIVSRITRKIIAMYDSDNPADNSAILRAGWPGILEEEKSNRPTEVTFKIVYENRRPIAEDPVDGEVLGSSEGEEPDGVGSGVAQLYPPPPQTHRWGLEDMTPENDSQHTGTESGQAPQESEAPQDDTLSE